MKRILSLMMVMMLCLSCAVFAEESGYEKYAELFDLLEAKRYGEAHEYINRMENLQTVKQEGAAVTEVEITSENWQEYFELKEAPGWMLNDFGEVFDVSWLHVLCVRDEWADKVVLDASDIVFEYIYNYIDYKCKLDFAAKTIEFGEVMWKSDTSEVQTFRLGDSYMEETSLNGYRMQCPSNTVENIGMGIMQPDGETISYIHDNLTITRAKGTLVVTE